MKFTVYCNLLNFRFIITFIELPRTDRSITLEVSSHSALGADGI